MYLNTFCLAECFIAGCNRPYLFPAGKASGTVIAETIIATGPKKIDNGMLVSAYKQAGIPVTYFARGKRQTAIRADPAPRRALEYLFVNLLFVIITIRAIIAIPSVRKANMGLATAPLLIVRFSSTASNNLKRDMPQEPLMRAHRNAVSRPIRQQ